MRRGAQWTLLWIFCLCGWALALAYIIYDVRGGALDLF